VTICDVMLRHVTLFLTGNSKSGKVYILGMWCKVVPPPRLFFMSPVSL
jgi:hypothetical protein